MTTATDRAFRSGNTRHIADRKVHFLKVPVAGVTVMGRLKIVWKNPNPAPRKRRWYELASDFGRRIYLVEELVPQGSRNCWAQAVALEIIRGGRAVA